MTDKLLKRLTFNTRKVLCSGRLARFGLHWSSDRKAKPDFIEKGHTELEFQTRR
jgi:hypothetical protein